MPGFQNIFIENRYFCVLSAQNCQLMQILIKSVVLIILLAGCKTYQTKYPYSLSDFDPKLRTHLEKIIKNGGLCDYDYSYEQDLPDYYDYLTKETSAKDLYRLINCEHPVLRAYAFNCLVEREDTAINHILLDHLDDTAIITRCMGEFGEDYIYVSDYFISQSNRNSKILKEHLANKVITNHTYLSYAYFFVADLETPEEKYYSIIKQMAKEPGGIRATERETIAIRALSKYNKVEDIPFIAEKLSPNWTLSEYNQDSCFSIIAHNPDTAYFKIIERYYRMIARPQGREELQNTFVSHYFKLESKYGSFIDALISFKNKKSSAITDTILQRKLYPFYFSRGEDYRYLIYSLLKKNECPEYKKLIAVLQPEAIAIEKKRAKYQLYPMEVTLDSSFSDKHNPRYW